VPYCSLPTATWAANPKPLGFWDVLLGGGLEGGEEEDLGKRWASCGLGPGRSSFAKGRKTFLAQQGCTFGTPKQLQSTRKEVGGLVNVIYQQ